MARRPWPRSFKFIIDLSTEHRPINIAGSPQAPTSYHKRTSIKRKRSTGAVRGRAAQPSTTLSRFSVFPAAFHLHDRWGSTVVATLHARPPSMTCGRRVLCPRRYTLLLALLHPCPPSSAHNVDNGWVMYFPVWNPRTRDGPQTHGLSTPVEPQVCWALANRRRTETSITLHHPD